jgi:hypothetical protein
VGAGDQGGFQVVLDENADEGHILIKDIAPFTQVTAALALLATQGWLEVNPDEAMEPYVFADGGLGVKTWLFRPANDVERAC